MKLSVIIPAYNELATLPRVLTRVVQALPEIPKEIVIVDDGSNDGTREWLQQTFHETNPHPVAVVVDRDQVALRRETTRDDQTFVRVILNERNRGKGAALRGGFKAATGDVLVIQDADLEYDPQDWGKMWRLIVDGSADVVFGSRFYGEPHRVLYFHHYLGNKVICNLINWLCDINLSDPEVCTKMFRREVLQGMNLVSNDFGFEVEFTVKSTKSKRWRIYETGISYHGRTYAEGKKINWKDGVVALWYVVKFRFFA